MSATSIGVLIFSIIWWVLCWPGHRDPGKLTIVIRVPSWLSWLCGRPRPDHKLKLELIIAQIGSLIAIMSWLPIKLLKLNGRQQDWLHVSIVIATLVAFFLVVTITNVLIWLRKRDEDPSES